jgi:hypothetical protein
MANALAHSANSVNQSSIHLSALNLHEFPIHAAAAFGCPETLTRVIASCSWRDVYSSDQFGRTPLHLAAAAGAVASVSLLTHPAMLELQHGVVGNALNAPDRESRWTALHWAAYSGHLHVMSVLLQAGADQSVRDSDGMTAWELLDASIFENLHSHVSRNLALPPKVRWRCSNKSEAFSFGLTTNYCLGYDSGCHVVSKPRSVSLPSDCEVLATACSSTLSLFVTKDGAVYACGLGDHDRLMMQVPFCVEPVRLPLSPRVVSVAIGKRHCLALTAGGDVFGWGCNDRCQLGNVHAIRQHERLLPVKILSGMSAVSAGFAHSAAVSSGGDALFVWGDNAACQCSQPRACSLVRSPTAAQIPFGCRVTAVSCGQRHTSFVATPDDVAAADEKSSAYVFGVGSAAITHLLLLPALSQTLWHVMPDCKVAAVTAGEDWTAVVTLSSQRCYLWRHGAGPASPSLVPVPRHVKVCRATAAPSRLVLLLSDYTVVSFPVHKLPSDRGLGTSETLCRAFGCCNIAASDGTCFLICDDSFLCDDGVWRDVAAGSVRSHQLPLQRMCEVALCPTLTAALAPSALQLALSIGAPVLAVAAAFACLMDPMYTCSCSLSGLAWGLLETVLSRLKLGRSKRFDQSVDELNLVRAVAMDLVGDWAGLMLHLIELEGSHACTGSWQASIPRLSKLSKQKQKQRREAGSESRAHGTCGTSPSSINSPILSPHNHTPLKLQEDVRESSVAPELDSHDIKSTPLVAPSEPSVQIEHFPPLAHNVPVQKLGSARSQHQQNRQARPPQPRAQSSTPPLPFTPLLPSSPAASFQLDLHEFPMLSDAAAVSPALSACNLVTPKTKTKAIRSDRSAFSDCATTSTTTLEADVAAVPSATSNGTSKSKKHRQKYRYDLRSNLLHAALTHPFSSVELSSAKDLKGWGPAASSAAAAVPLSSIMREQQDLKRKKDRERVQLQDSVWQQVW